VVTELKIVGGDPALDLVNTVGDDRVADPLDDYGSFAAWAARVGAIDDATAARLAARGRERAAAAERALAEARSLRAAADAVFRPLAIAGERPPAGGDEPPADALARLVARAGAAVERARFARAGAAVERARLAPAGAAPQRGGMSPAGGGFALTWEGDYLERPLWPIAVAAVDLLRSGPLDRLKACEECPWLFLDTSRNRSRRWCSMDDCGSRRKMRRYRERRATAGR
jgi:predicted RNA-binding Zn ribbon-like protein